MKVGMWAYPWDMIDKGPAQAVNELVDIGIDRVYVAANYHTVESFSTHNPKQKITFAESGAYYQPSGDYGSLAPVTNPEMGEDDWIARIGEAVEDSSLEMNAWVVGCHSTKLGMEHKELTLESSFGDRLVFGLCPSQPAVQQYLTSMLTDLDEYPFEDLMLETFHYFHGSGWSWHHDKFHTDIGELGEFLLGLCFCDACHARAESEGVDVESARRQTREAILALGEGELDPETDMREWIEKHESVQAMVDIRKDTLTDLYRELIDVTDANIGPFIGMKGIDRSWMHGLDLESLDGMVDFFTLMSYRPETSAVIETYERALDRVSGTEVRPGLLPGHPIVDSKETAIDQIVALDEAAATETVIYNYGLLPKRNLGWVREGIKQID